MFHEFTLVLTVPEVTDDQVNSLYEAGLDDGTVSSSGRITRIDVTRDVDSLELAIHSAIGQVNAVGLSVATVEIEAERIVQQPAV
jgi:hypothetical protein